jgi:hypothetical protein
MRNLLIVDPLTLLGREALAVIASDPAAAGSIGYLHTAEDEEHQITELGGTPALVPPVTDGADLAGYETVLIASDAETSRSGFVVDFIEDHPDLPTVVMGPRSRLHERTIPATGAAERWTSRHVHVAHPALVSLCAVVDSLHHLEPVGATVAAVEPVSVRGTDAVERLARQAAQRLQGSEVGETIGGQVLAFTSVATDDEDLNRDATLLLPDLSVSVTRTESGCFHGHLSHLGLFFPDPVSETEVLDALRNDERFAGLDFPVGLDATIDSDLVTIGLPRLAADGRTLALTAMVDGLRVGGALTALEILRSLTAPG